MAYHLDPALPTVEEVRRVLGEQLGAAIEELGQPGSPDAEAVHDVRRRIKKARSLLRLARAQLGAEVVRLAQADLRTVALALAPQREADARHEALRDLAQRLDQRGSDLVRQVDRALAGAATSSAPPSLDRRAALGARVQLQRTGAWLGRVPPLEHGWAAIEPGLRREYARGRARYRGLPEQPSPVELHEWRKRVKDLWYHERLLRDAWPAGAKPIIRAAGELAAVLGTDHDLALVAIALQAGPGGVLVAPEVGDEVGAAIARRRHELQSRARHLGALVHADHPDAWVARHRRWWAEARRVTAADPSPGGATA